VTVTESQRCDQSHRNGHITDSHKSWLQHVIEESANRHEDCCHDLAKWLSHYLYFFSFLFFYLGFTTQKKVQESVMSQVSHSHSHMTGSHNITSHDVT